MQPRGRLVTRRMSAHWVVLVAAALTTLPSLEALRALGAAGFGVEAPIICDRSE